MPIAILGTGRSGTSMITRMLNMCGLYLGEQENLQYSCSNPAMNPAGYWEHPEIHSLMDRLFEHVGGTWENPPVLAQGWEYDPSIEPYYTEAQELIARLFRGHDNWGWKLPKATVTIAFWQRVVPEMKLIICVRNPLDFAHSLGKHVSISRAHLFAMWQYYNYSILAATLPQNRFVTFYEDYFPCYRNGLLPLLDFAGLDIPTPGEDIERRILAFHDQSLKHHTSTLADVLADDTVPYVTRQLYVELLSGNTDAADLPLLHYQGMLLPLLQGALVGESVLDGSGAVTMAKYQKLKRKLALLRAGKTWPLGFFTPRFFKHLLDGFRLSTYGLCLLEFSAYSVCVQS